MLADWEEHQIIEEGLRGVWGDCKTELGEVVEYVLSAPGKRVRPLILLISSEAFGCPPTKALNAALAIELAHAASLVHDDIIDSGVQRRGAPSTVQRFGMEAALLAGDYLISKSIGLISTYSEETIKTFSKACVEMAEGEYLDLSRISSAGEYYQCVSKKTASLFAASAKLGCLIAGAEKENTARYEKYGFHLGLGYQIVDDLEEILGMDQGKKSLKTSTTLPRIHSTDRSMEKSVELCTAAIRDHALSAKESLQNAGGSQRMKERLIWIVDRMTSPRVSRCELLKNPC